MSFLKTVILFVTMKTSWSSQVTFMLPRNFDLSMLTKLYTVHDIYIQKADKKTDCVYTWQGRSVGYILLEKVIHTKLDYGNQMFFLQL